MREARMFVLLFTFIAALLMGCGGMTDAEVRELVDARVGAAIVPLVFGLDGQIEGPLVIANDGENVHSLRLENYGPETPRIVFRSAGGTAANPEPPKPGKLPGWIIWSTYDIDGQWKTIGNIEMGVAAPPAGRNAVPGYMALWTVTDDTFINTEKLRINPDGAIIVGRGDGVGHLVGEGGTIPVTGTIIRAPDIVTGGAGDVAGADVVIAGGLGTGQGRVGRIIFSTPRSAAPGDNVQVRQTIMELDGDRIVLFGGRVITAEILDKLLALVEE